jgi:two-component system sensor histidine kinase KdpD
LSRLPEDDRDAVERHLNFARNLHLETRVVEGADAAAALVEFARRNQVTQIFVARPREKPRWLPALSKNIVQRIVGLAKDMQVVIVSKPDRVMH